MPRVLVTLLTVFCLSATYRLYASYVVPLTESVSAPSPPPLSQFGEGGLQPTVFAEIADEFFPDAPWTRKAELKWQREDQAFLFSNEITREDETGNMVRFSPLAILWKDPKRPEAPPFRILAEGARLQFENQFFDSAIHLSNANPGRIVWAVLEGEVHIDGPDGLVLDGEQFVFSEESAQLYSDRRITFRYGPTPEDQTRVSGSAEQVMLRLEPSDEPLFGHDMPRIGGLAGMMLRRNVEIDIHFEEKGKPTQARITSTGPFDYNVARQIVTFEDDVRVRRWTTPADARLEDSLACEWLGIEFEQAEKAGQQRSATGQNFLDGIQFRRMRALRNPYNAGRPGTQVVLKSDEHDLHATMQELAYDARTRVLKMIDDRRVTVTRGPARFMCPRVELEHGERSSPPASAEKRGEASPVASDAGLERLECIGAGSLTYEDERLGPHPVEATWEGRVDVHPDESGALHVVQLSREARFALPGQMQMAADRMTLWLDLEKAEQAGLRPPVPSTSPAADGTDGSGKMASSSAGTANGSDEKTDDVLHKPLPLKRARAEGTVRMVSPQLIVRRANSIEAVISQGKLPEAEQPPARSDQRTRSRETDDSAQQPWNVWTDAVEIAVTHDITQGKLEVRRVEGDGEVRIRHQPDRAASVGSMELDGPLELTGIRLVADNAGGMDQVVTIFGDVNEKGDVRTPAMAAFGQVRIGGTSISMNRLENRVTIPGAGAFQAPLSRDLEGEPLEKPGLMEVRWRERMDFDGQAAQFFGAVRSSFQDERRNTSLLHCEELQVQLNERISFTETDPQPEGLTIELVRARHGVRVEAYEHEGTKLIGVRRGELAEFEVRQSTGEFTGLGPGEFDVWSFGDSVRFTPGEAAQANQPARRSQPNWRYTNVRFAGKLVGNVHQNVAELHERVNLLSAPVDEALVKFKPEDLYRPTSQAANSVILNCEKLRITQRQVEGGARNDERSRGAEQQRFSELFATGSTELLGQFGRAVADELSFDERHGRFVLRGIGRDATLHYQKAPGEPFETSSHRMIQFVPSRGSITFDGSTGVSGGL
jgi:hypothetical protein